jgi:hypothetical protein
MKIEQAIAAFQQFCGPDLTATLARVESAVSGTTSESLASALESFAASKNALSGAIQIKQIVGQLNVVIHALGILLCLPKILESGEIVLNVSLGAGNTGRKFDLETNLRVAEFKFIQWQGGAESIRQNSLFKDFFFLAEYKPQKLKELYVMGTEHPLKFLTGRRALTSVLSKDVNLQQLFQSEFGDQYKTVGDYFRFRREAVAIRDVSAWVTGLA